MITATDFVALKARKILDKTRWDVGIHGINELGAPKNYRRRSHQISHFRIFCCGEFTPLRKMKSEVNKNSPSTVNSLKTNKQ
jgi:hypothetical protein